MRAFKNSILLYYYLFATLKWRILSFSAKQSSSDYLVWNIHIFLTLQLNNLFNSELLVNYVYGGSQYWRNSSVRKYQAWEAGSQKSQKSSSALNFWQERARSRLPHSDFRSFRSFLASVSFRSFLAPGSFSFPMQNCSCRQQRERENSRVDSSSPSKPINLLSVIWT